MAKQFTIIATDKDLRQIEGALQRRGDVNLFSEMATPSLEGLEPLEALSIPPDKAGACSLFCYLAPRGLPERVCVRRISDVKTDIDLKRSHVIEFWRPFFNGKVIRPGRFYFQNALLKEGGLLGNDTDFYRWADSVMSQLRGGLVRNKKEAAYMGPDAVEGLASGRFILESIT